MNRLIEYILNCIFYIMMILLQVLVCTFLKMVMVYTIVCEYMVKVDIMEKR